MMKWKDKRSMGPTNIKWWKCKDEMMVEYRERVRRKYEELDAEKETMECEWRQYKDAFVGVAEELCSSTSGKGGTTRIRNQGWWTEDVAKAAICLEPPSSVRREVEVEQRGQEEMETAMHNMEKARRQRQTKCG